MTMRKTILDIVDSEAQDCLDRLKLRFPGLEDGGPLFDESALLLIKLCCQRVACRMMQQELAELKELHKKTLKTYVPPSSSRPI